MQVSVSGPERRQQHGPDRVITREVREREVGRPRLGGRTRAAGSALAREREASASAELREVNEAGPRPASGAEAQGVQGQIKMQPLLRVQKLEAVQQVHGTQNNLCNLPQPQLRRSTKFALWHATTCRLRCESSHLLMTS